MKSKLIFILRWALLPVACLVGYLLSYTIGYWLLKITIGFLLPKTLHFLLGWPNAAIASMALIYLSFLIAPNGKKLTVFISFGLVVIMYTLYLLLVIQGQVQGVTTIQVIFEFIGACMGGGGLTYFMVTDKLKQTGN